MDFSFEAFDSILGLLEGLGAAFFPFLTSEITRET